MWEDLHKAYKEKKNEVHKAFNEIGSFGALSFMANAKRLTTQKKVVVTGTYRNSWKAESDKRGINTTIDCVNEAEYASHLEFGHRIVTRSGVDTGKKTQGTFIGKESIDKTRKSVINRMIKELKEILK